MRLAAILGLICLVTASATAAGNDDTLRFYLAKSDAAVFGEITSSPLAYSTQFGVVNHAFDFQVMEVLKGELVAGSTIQTTVTHAEINDEERLSLSSGLRCILFLKRARPGEKPAWQTADPWFGFQRANSTLRTSLKRLGSHSTPNTQITR